MDKICESDPWYSEVKRWKKEEERRWFLADGCDGIPTKCPCGAGVVVEPSHLPGTDVGRRYLICSEFEDNDLHLKKLWVEGVEEEATSLRRKVDRQAEELGLHAYRIEQLQKENAKLKEELNKNGEEIAKLKARFEKIFGKI